MERRVAGIIRWLERCVRAYKEGAVESALMEAECARADIEALRGELWNKLEGRCCVSARRFSFFRTAEAFFWAVGIMLLTAAPLALQQDGPAKENRAEGHLTLEWLTPDEMELLGNLRRRPDDMAAADSEPAPAVAEPEEPVAELGAVLASVAGPARRVNLELPSRRERKEQSEQKESETSLPYDRILSLIEMGERAMKDEPPAIRVENSR
ncbi:MAG: hypothetical protein FWG71_06625 [Synergistaceae bacterium]|nr:hypothetical protein [Synergistaceae bacterium]